MSSVLLSAETVVTLDPDDRIHSPGHVVVEGSRIVSVGGRPGPSEAADAHLDLGDRLLMPGLVNCHTHTPMVLFRGLAEGHSILTLEGWLQGIRVWEEVLDPDWVPPAVAVSCAEMIRTGTTCFADQYFFMDQVTPVVARSGLRATLAYGIVEMGDDRARSRELAAAEASLSRLDGGGLVRGWVGPHAFFVDNTPEAIRAEVALAERHEAGLHVHLATGGEEEAWCREHTGRGMVAELDRLGVLDRPVIAAHCNTLQPDDLPTLAERPFTAVMCASAGMRSGAPPAPARALLDAGVDVAVGTDNVANNNSHDHFAELATLAKLISLREGHAGATSPREVLDLATAGGARALGLEAEIGSLEPGKKADLISLDLTEVGWAPRSDEGLYAALVYSVSGMHVRDVMVDGRWLQRDGRIMSLDHTAAAISLAEARAGMKRRAMSPSGAESEERNERKVSHGA